MQPVSQLQYKRSRSGLRLWREVIKLHLARIIRENLKMLIEFKSSLHHYSQSVLGQGTEQTTAPLIKHQ